MIFGCVRRDRRIHVFALEYRSLKLDKSSLKSVRLLLQVSDVQNLMNGELYHIFSILSSPDARKDARISQNKRNMIYYLHYEII
jgi:hypothetical protein